MIFRTALTNEDITGNGCLSTENFYTESFTLRIAAVLYAAFPFFMCHQNKFENLEIPIHLCDIRYFNLCIVCTMSVFLTKSFSSVHFKRDHFIALDMTEDFNFYHALYVLACSEFTIRAG